MRAIGQIQESKCVVQCHKCPRSREPCVRASVRDTVLLFFFFFLLLYPNSCPGYRTSTPVSEIEAGGLGTEGARVQAVETALVPLAINCNSLMLSSFLHDMLVNDLVTSPVLYNMSLAFTAGAPLLTTKGRLSTNSTTSSRMHSRLITPSNKSLLSLSSFVNKQHQFNGNSGSISPIRETLSCSASSGTEEEGSGSRSSYLESFIMNKTVTESTSVSSSGYLDAMFSLLETTDLEEQNQGRRYIASLATTNKLNKNGYLDAMTLLQVRNRRMEMSTKMKQLSEADLSLPSPSSSSSISGTQLEDVSTNMDSISFTSSDEDTVKNARQQGYMAFLAAANNKELDAKQNGSTSSSSSINEKQHESDISTKPVLQEEETPNIIADAVTETNSLADAMADKVPKHIRLWIDQTTRKPPSQPISEPPTLDVRKLFAKAQKEEKKTTTISGETVKEEKKVTTAEVKVAATTVIESKEPVIMEAKAPTVMEAKEPTVVEAKQSVIIQTKEPVAIETKEPVTSEAKDVPTVKSSTKKTALSPKSQKRRILSLELAYGRLEH